MLRFGIICAALLLTATTISFSIYVWPTKYTWDHITLGPSNYPVRIDRFTLEGEYLSPTQDETASS